MEPRAVTNRAFGRRTFLAAVPAAGLLAAGTPAFAQTPSYAAFRVVRETAGDPSKPEIELPTGYDIVSGSEHAVASRAEYYTFVEGARTADGIEVRVRWPDTPVRTVIWQEDHLELTPDEEDQDAFTFVLPITQSSPGATQATIQVWSTMPTAPGILWYIEHNDPDRVAGPWLDVDWPAGQVSAVIHYLLAGEAILLDSGAAEIAAGKDHIYALMGFETNNTLHPDNPPHWHLAYFAGPDTSAPAYLPHFWFDEQGRNFYNGQDVTDAGRSEYRAGDPAPMYDFEGNLVLTQTIRSDGGLDIDPPGKPRYSIVPGTDGEFVAGLTVVRDGVDWLRIATVDKTDEGRMVFEIEDLRAGDGSVRTEHAYDRDTGVLTPARKP